MVYIKRCTSRPRRSHYAQSKDARQERSHDRAAHSAEKAGLVGTEHPLARVRESLLTGLCCCCILVVLLRLFRDSLGLSACAKVEDPFAARALARKRW